MNLDFLLAMAQSKQQLKKAWDDTRLDLLMATLDRLTTKETLAVELEKSVQNFIIKQSEVDAVSRDVSTQSAKGIQEEIMRMITSPNDNKEPTSYKITMPH